MKRLITHILLLFLLPINGSFAQQGNDPAKGRLDGLDLQVFELPNGEAGNHVQAIVQDKYGFLWFGSQYGLHRWDGSQFKTYLNDPGNANSPSSDYIETIYVAKDGTLWLGTWGAGLNHFDQKTGKFTRYYASRRDGLSDNFVNVITEDRQGNLWVGTLNGLDRLDPRTGEIDHYRNIPADKHSLSCNQVRALLVDSKGTLWVGTGFFFDDSSAGGLNRYNPESDDFDRYMAKPKDEESLSGNEIRTIFEDTQGNFWVGTNGDGLHLMNREAGTFERFQEHGNGDRAFSMPKGYSRSSSQLTFMIEDSEHRFWLGNWNGGIKCYDPLSDDARLYNVDGRKGSRLEENNGWTGYQSKDGVLWFSTAGNGGARVYRTTGKRGMFNSVGLPSKTDAVVAFVEDDKQNLLFSTTQNLVGKLNNKTLNDCLGPQYTEQDAVLGGSEKIVKDADGNLWGMKTSGSLTRYNPQAKTTKQFTHQKDNPQSLPLAPLRDLLPDKKGNLWLATYGAGLVFFDGKTEEFTSLRSKKNDENSLPHDYTGKLFMDAEGSLWITGGGKDASKMPFFITRFAPATQTFTRYKINDVPEGSNFWQSPPSQDKNGFIWVCLDAGILKLNPETGQCGFYDQNRLGKKGAHLKGMTMDNEGRLWILSDKLLAFDPVKETVFSYGIGSGLQAMPFEQDAIYKNAKGEIFVGGRYGFHFFDPSQLDSMNMTPPDVRITGFELLDKDGPENRFDASVLEGHPINLSHEENVFSFSFSTLDFNDPAANRLEFRLEGMDDDWRVAGQDLKATYVKVPPGTYTFRVRGANSYGVWGKEMMVVVHVASPWWSTWWAWALYLVLVACAIFMAYRFLLNRKMEKAETLRLKELDAVKNRLFTNITHEFRTPLTIILGMAEQLAVGSQQLAVCASEKEKMNDGLEMIQRNGTNLLGLVNQMLELSKMENGSVSLNLQQGEVVAHLKYVTQNFHSLAADKKIGLHFLSDLDAQMMDFDAEQLQKVLSNLLSNAMKFTPSGGNVYVTVGVMKDFTNSQNLSNLTIKVRDTGVGIPPDKLPHVFDRFFQATTPLSGGQGGGTGIGLALTKELVKLMGGEISARSWDGEGTEFIVSLPVRMESRAVSGELRAKPAITGAKFFEQKEAAQEEATELELSESISTFLILKNEENIGGVPNEPPIEAENELPLLLLIEDNPDVMTYVKTCLSGNYRLLTASNGQEGVALATQHVPDLVVTDVMMPVMDGYQVCNFLKNDERTSHVPVIMLTAKAGLESRLEGLELGADAYLAKPFHREELLVQIRSLLATRRRLQRHYRSVAGIGNEHFPIKFTKPAAPEMKESEDYFVKKLRRAVEAHLDDAEFNVENLCKEIGMSHSHLHRKLSAVTGCSASKFIRQIRLSKAKELLEDPNLTITAVAFDSGFNDPGYFGRVFKQEFGMTPVEWRERLAGVEN
jgi:signal transduction histidine kinase/CheY-like chemotaxis protein/ligand-binding sensor domain-containing protein/AraC-like DNA-binding protein